VFLAAFFMLLTNSSASVEEISRLLEFQYKSEIESLSQEKNSLQQTNQKLEAELKVLRGQVKALQKQVRKSQLKKSSQTDPSPSEEERELYSIALRAIDREDWEEALLRMEHFVLHFSKSDLADNAVFWMAHIYAHKKENALALAELDRLMRDYPKTDRLQKAAGLREKLQKRGERK
jgi:TolA-binding protein